MLIGPVHCSSSPEVLLTSTISTDGISVAGVGKTMGTCMSPLSGDNIVAPVALFATRAASPSVGVEPMADLAMSA